MADQLLDLTGLQYFKQQCDATYITEDDVPVKSVKLRGSTLTPDAQGAVDIVTPFFLGVTGGRAISGFVTYRLNDTQMVRLGQGIIAAGVALLILPLGEPIALAGLVLIGLGCAPIYPCIIHSTPAHFGAARSQALIGVQMASAYVGTLLMPPLFGALAARSSLAIFPLYLLVLLAVMAASHAALCRKTNP